MLSLFLSMSLFASGDARWLQLCDKGPHAPPRGSIEWESAPLREDLLDSLKTRGWTLRHAYKWENKISAIPGPNGVLPACVTDAGPVATAKIARNLPVAARSARSTGVDPFTIAIKAIWDTMGIEPVREWLAKSKNQAPGAGTTIAVIDGKFVRNHLAFAGMSIQDTFDFVANTPDPWDRKESDWSDVHGTSTTSLIGSSWEGLPGIAPAAHFLLYRAEDAASESTQEEDNLAAALVRAVDKGADVISVSLGYRFFDANNSVTIHPWEDYDGRTLVASRAATAAVRHGAIVVVSVGNEGNAGNEGGRSIGSPADADSVLAVGAIDGTLRRCSKTWTPSWGPTADGRQKPDVSAFGCSVPVASGPGINDRTETQGTSVAAPLVAGLAALARQVLDPKLSANEIRLKIFHSGHLWPQLDLQLGAGLPDLRRITEIQSFLQPGGTPSTFANRPQLTWSQGVLRFSASSAILGSHLGVEVSDATGQLVFHRESAWRGEPLWKPGIAGRPKHGLLFARWWGDYGKGSTRLLVVP
ncbi:MAG: S8 family serine peptidase [Fibrobacteres bacterium]|nr:S8 family serine peptidase [Fibrobacterota bacterium]